MLVIDQKIHLVVDASVLVAVFNKLDKFHSKALEFTKVFLPGKRALIPAHALFEMNAACVKKIAGIRSEAYLGHEKGEVKIEFDTLHITSEFADLAEQKKLFEKFPKLRGGDLIYACVAHIYSIPLVTFDHDFDEYKDILEVINLDTLYSTIA